MASGSLLYALGRDRGWARVEGYGISVLAQGGALFVFDLVMALAHERVAAGAPGLALVPRISRGGAGVVVARRF
jgi:hypothetical protein